MITDPHTDRILKENEALKKQLAMLQDKVSAEGAHPAPKHQGEPPRYKLIKPFVAPGCIYLDPEQGDEEIEWWGIPNEAMEPLNEPAERRMRAWIASLPHGVIPQEFIVQASWEFRPKEGEVQPPFAELNAKIMRRAHELHCQRTGKAVADEAVHLPKKVEDVPLMTSDTKVIESQMRDGEKAVVVPVDRSKKTRQVRRITTSPDGESAALGS